MTKSAISIVLVALTFVGGARAEETVSEARNHYDKGLAAFALGRYSDAADEYEKAFSLKTDSALLYNAAQAHRLAGHYDRALHLYQSYLRIFGKRVKNGPKVQQHIDELEKIVSAQAQEKDRPPVDVMAPSQNSVAETTTAKSEEPPPPAQLSAPADADAARLTVTATRRSKGDKPVYKKPWFWITVGGVAIAAGVGVGLGLGLSAKNPSPSFGATVVQ